MSEPIYDEDIVNLGYLKRIISNTEDEISETYENVSRHHASKPQPPYSKGDTWIDGDVVYTCINSRQIGSYVDSDWVTESGATEKAENKNKTYLTKPSNYSPGDMWILQSDNDHKAGKKGEILISTAGRKDYDEDDWINMLGYGAIRSINEVANNLNNAIDRIGNVEEAIEDGIIVTFYQDSVPEGKHLGDLWYVTGEVEGYTKGKIYRYDGADWILLDDPAIQEAFNEANEARLVADGKIQSFYSDTEPTEGMGVGDLWIDIANNNQLYRYNGTNWVAVYDTRVGEAVTNIETITSNIASIDTDLGSVKTTVSETTTKLNNDYLTAEQVNSKLEATDKDLEILQKKQTETETTAEGFKVQIDSIINDGVSKVKTSMGYTFGDDGLIINKEDAETGTIIDEASVRVIDKTGPEEQDLLYAGYVKEDNEDYPNYVGQTIVASTNMIVKNYLVVPNSRFEAYENPILGGTGTGAFEV